MGEMLGADPDQLDRLGVALAGLADQVDGIRCEVNSLLGRTVWLGRDGDTFRADWQGRWSHLLVAVAAAGREGAGALRNNAVQQRVASGGDGGGSGWSGSSWSAGGLERSASPFESAGKAFVDGVFWGIGAVDLLIDAKAFKGVDPKTLAVLGKRLSIVGIVEDAVSLGYGLATDPGSNDTANAGVGLVLGTAAIVAGAICPPAGIAIGAVGLLYGIATQLDPTLGRDLVDGFVNGATTVWEGVSAVADGAWDLAEGVGAGANAAAEAAAGAISGGVDFLKGWLGQ
ncbi:hypothetical protein [Actinokineospora fastidiosa]|uniref:WXG100 family type VII secretion target n=1 Tax=Actinokineospora fastidiosa TaxID=1816 RepID=A0A918LIX5_9PSEU|nr:hypothetical protein [Actinokineospora fastidiosa]GGS54270.1 hypothetical protein GCM10010171_56740 [Actinokineospora fastidiosa]